MPLFINKYIRSVSPVSTVDVRRIQSQLINNRIMLLKALQKAGLSVSHTPDYIFSDIFTDADGWLNTVDTNGTDAIYGNNIYMSKMDKTSANILIGPSNTTADAGYSGVLKFCVEYVGQSPQAYIHEIYNIQTYDDVSYIHVYFKYYNTGQVFYEKSFSVPSRSTVSLDVSDSPPFTANTPIEVVLDHDGYIRGKLNLQFDSTKNNVRVFSIPNTVVPIFSIKVGEATSFLSSYIKTNTFSLPSPIKQLLVFADRELVNNAQEMEVEVYDTNDTLLASGTIGELIDISEYNKSSVYLKLKLHGSGSAYTKAYGYGVAFWV